MKKIWKRSISLFLAFVMVFGMLPVSAFADETEPVITEEPPVTEAVAAEAAEISAEETTQPVTEPPVPETTVPVTEASGDVPEADAKEIADAAANSAVTPEETEATEPQELFPRRVRAISAVPSGSFPSNDDLFTGYANQVWFGTGAAMFGTTAGRQLDAATKAVYDALVPQLKAIASGSRTSAMIRAGADLSGDYGSDYAPDDPAAAFNLSPSFDLDALLDALLADMPYDLYWYDKTIGTYCEIYSDPTGTRFLTFFYFTVASQYNDGIPTQFIDWETNEEYRDPMYCDTAYGKIAMVQNTADAALAVMNEVAADPNVKTDYDKLKAYKDWICDSTDYNDAAVLPDYNAEITDPWQLIHVFDGDPSTMVVCEGYSKAFQYLCDLTFSKEDPAEETVTCYSVTGDLVGVGAHMWNIVEIEGNHYLVDVTNSDDGTVGADESLFLVGGTADASGIYTFNTLYGSTAGFRYSTDTQNLWKNSGILTLAATNYEPPAEEVPGTMSQAAFEAALAAAAGGTYTLTSDVTLTEDMTLPCNVTVADGATLTVADGTTLTVAGYTLTVCSDLYIQEGGRMIVQNNGWLYVPATDPSDNSDNTDTEIIVDGKLLILAGGAIKTYGGPDIDTPPCVIVINGIMFVASNAASYDFCFDGNGLVMEGETDLDARLLFYGCCNWGDGFRVDWEYASTMLTMEPGDGRPGLFCIREWDAANYEFKQTVIDPDDLTVGNYLTVFTWADDPYCPELDESDPFVNQIANIQAQEGAWDKQTSVSYTLNGTTYSFPIRLERPQTCAFYSEPIASNETYLGYNYTIDPDKSENSFYFIFTSQEDWTVVPGSFRVVDNPFDENSMADYVTWETISNTVYKITIKPDVVDALAASGDALALHGALEAKDSYGYTMTFGMGQIWCQTEQQDIYYDFHGFYTTSTASQETMLYDTLMLDPDAAENAFYYILTNPDFSVVDGTFQIMDNPADRNPVEGVSYQKISDTVYKITVSPEKVADLAANGGFLYIFVELDATSSVNGYTGSYSWGQLRCYVGGEMTQAEFAAALAANAGTNYVLTKSVTITEDMTISMATGAVPYDHSVKIPSGVTLTVANGATLTTETSLLVDNGTLVVENGSKLALGSDDRYSCLYLWGGTLDIAAQTGLDMSNGQIFMEHGQNCSLPGWLSLSRVTAQYYIRQQSDLAELENLDQYACADIYVQCDLVIDEDLALTHGENLYVHAPNSLTVSEGVTLTLGSNNMLFNGEGAVINNNGTILCHGYFNNYGTLNGNAVEFGSSEMDEADLLAALNDSATSGTPYVLNQKVTLTAATVFPSGAQLHIVEGGRLTVSSGVHLINLGDIQVNGGKFILLSGSAITSTGFITINSGIMFFANGVTYNIAGMNGPIIREAYGDTETQLVLYDFNDFGNGVITNWSHYRKSTIVTAPSMSVNGLPCIQEWDSENYEWIITPVDVAALTAGDYLTVQKWVGPTFSPDEPNADKYVSIRVADDAIGQTSYVSCNYNGTVYTLNFRFDIPENCAFYSEPAATAENYLGFRYSIDPSKSDNSFYFIFTKPGWSVVPGSFTVIDNPFDQNPVDHVTWTQLSDTIYKITVKPEAVEAFCATGGAFPVHGQVEATNSNGLRNVFGMGQLWCEAPLSEEAFRNAVAEAAKNGEEFSLRNDLTLTEDLTVECNLHVQSGVRLTVADGVKLTVKSYPDGNFAQLAIDGEFTVESGATLHIVHNSLAHAYYGTITVEDGATILSEEDGVISEGAYDNIWFNQTQGGKVYGVADELLGIEFYPRTSADLEAALATTGYAHVHVFLKEDLVLDRNIQVPGYASIDVSEGSALKVPAGITLTNNGDIYVQPDNRLEVLMDGTLVNNGIINVDYYGQFVVRGTLNDNGTINGTITWGGMSHEELMAVIENCENNGSSWVHESETILETGVNGGVLQIAMGEGPAFYLDDGGVIRVPAGCTLKVFNPLILTGGKVIVEAGGTLDAGDGHMEIHEGTVYAEQGATVIDNGHIQGKVTWEGETDPWLSETWLDNREEGWFMNPDNEIHEAHGLHVMDNHWRIYFLNTWDAENMVWNATPVVPTENSNYMTITRIMDMEDQFIRGDQEYAEYFVCVDVFGTMEHQNVNLFVDGIAYPYELFARTAAFYSAPEISMDTLITGGHYSMSGQGDEEAIYWLVTEPEYYDVLNFSWDLNTWDEDYTQYTGGDPLVKLDDTQAEQGIYKFVIDPDYVEYTKFNWKNFNLRIHMELDDNRDGEGNIHAEHMDWELWIDPAPQAEPQAHLRINDQTYLIFENNIVYRDFFTGEYDEQGREIWDREQCSLPAGVSYVLKDNKLILDNADLERLELAHMDCWEDENGYHEEQRLPSADLNLVVYGESSVMNDDECAMVIRGTNVNISGTGSLHLYAKNSPDNINDQGNRYAYPTVRIEDGSSLNLSGSVSVTAEIDGSGFHGDMPAQMSAIDGYSEDPASGNTLTVSGNSVLNIVTPEGARTLDESQENYPNTRGIVSTNIEVNDNATLNTGSIYLWDGVDFTQNGGTVNLDPIGEIFYHPRLGDFYISRLGVYLENADSVFTMNGGTMNIHSEPDEADHNEFCRAIFQGISANIGDVNINGGEINIFGDGNDGGSGIAVHCAWDENNNPVEGLPTGNLYITGGTVNIYSSTASEYEGIYTSALSDAVFSGGAVYADGGTHYFEGCTEWTGSTELTGNAYILDGAEILVKDGATLTVNDSFTVEEGGRIIVEDGGILDIQGGLEIEGTVYIRYGGDVHYGEGHWLNGKITWEGDTAPYLTSTWLDNYDNEGWYMNEEFHEIHGLMSMEEHWRIFFLNTWDATNLVWNSVPVVPSESNEFMTITRVVDMEDQHIREDQDPAYSEYFVRVEVYGTLDRQDVILSANGYSVPFEVHERHTGFFRTTEFTMDSLVQGHDFVLDPTAEENSLYWLVRDPVNYDVVQEEFSYRTWNDQDYSDYITGEDLIVLDDSRKDEGIYKITVDPGFVDYVQYDFKNFEIRVTMTLDHNGDGEIHEEPNHGGMWIQPPELKKPAAGLLIDNIDYMIFDTGRIFRDVFVGYDDQGHEIWKRQETSLPAGVSYILSENRLILDGVDLTALHLKPSASGTDENGFFWEVYGLPNENLTISLVGNSTIENHCGPAVAFDHGINVTIEGNGSLYAKTTNYPDYRDENGNLQCFSTINVHGGSTLTIGGNATVTAELSGHGYWENGEGATCHAISGSYEGDALEITGNATVTTVLPNGVRRYDNTGRTSQIGGYVGIQNFDTVTVSGGTLNTDHLNFYEGGQFNLTDGTANFRDIGEVYNFTDREGNDVTECHYAGINMRGGSVNISGGILNIDVSARDGESFDRSGFYGINVVNGTMDVTGGEINITGSTDGWAILADCEWTEDGWVDGTGSILSITGGTINVDAPDRTYHGGIVVSEICDAYFGGGEINDDYGIHRFFGETIWEGTVLNGIAANVYTHGPGNFYMYGGQMNLTGEEVENDINNALFESNGPNTFIFDGEINLTNGTFRNQSVTYVDGGKITVDNDYAGLAGLQNIKDNDYPAEEVFFAVSNGIIDVTANGTAIVNEETFYQMGGEITATNTSGSKPVMVSAGQTSLNNGSLNLYGNGGVGLVQGYNLTLAADDIEDNESALYVGPVDVDQYPSLNISGTQIGLYVNGPVAIMEGSSVDIQVEGEPINTDRDCPMAIYVEKHTGNPDLSGDNVSVLYIDGGTNVDLVSRDTAGVDAMSKGIVAWYAPVEISCGEVPANVTIDAEMAVYSVSDSLDNTNFNEDISFFSESGSTLTLTSRDCTETEETGDYLHTLMDGGDYVGYATVGTRTYSDLDAFIAAMQAAADAGEFYWLTESVIVDRDIEIIGMVNIADGAELIVKDEAVLTIPEATQIIVCDGGILTVEAGGRVVHQGTFVTNVGGIVRIHDDGDYAGYVRDSELYFGQATEGTDLDTVTGIPRENISLEVFCETEDQISYILGVYEEFFEARIFLQEDVTLHTMTIPEDVSLNVRGCTVTVAEGAFLTVNGYMSLYRGELVIDGTLISNGNINTNYADVTVNGILNNKHPLFINNDSQLTVNGTLNNYEPLHVGFWKAPGAEGLAGTLNIAAGGVLNNYDYLNICSDAYIEEDDRYCGGIVTVSGTLNNLYKEITDEATNTTTAEPAFIEQHGDLTVDGMLYNEGILGINGSVTVNGSLTNRNVIDVDGTLDVYGTLENNSSIRMNGATSRLTTYEGASLVNNMSISNRTLGAVITLAENTYSQSSTAELVQTYFEGGHLTEINGAPHGTLGLMYEGSNPETVLAVSEMFNRSEGYYYNCFLRVVGDMTFPAGKELNLAPNTYLVVLNNGNNFQGSLTVEGSIFNQGYIRLFGADMTVTESGWITNKGAIETGMMLTEKPTVTVGGLLENASTGIVDMTAADFVLEENGVMQNNLAGENLGTVNGIPVSQQTLFSEITDDQAQLQKLIDKVRNDGYHAGYFWISSDLHITSTVIIPGNITLAVKDTFSLTIDPNVVVENKGCMVVEQGGNLNVDGILAFTEGSVDLRGTMTVAPYGQVSLGQSGQINVAESGSLINKGYFGLECGTINGNIDNRGTVSVTWIEGNVGKVNGTFLSGADRVDLYMPFNDVAPDHDEADIQTMLAYAAENSINRITVHFTRDYTFVNDFTVPQNMTFVVGAYRNDAEFSGTTVTIPAGKTLTINGTVQVAKKSALVIEGNAALNSTGSFYASGSCGANAAWVLNNDVLTISGAGDMLDYAKDSAPWAEYASLINTVKIDTGITGIGNNAFGNISVDSILVPRNVASVGENAFADGVTLKVYHESAAETYAKANGNAITYIHELDPDTGACLYCDFGLEATLKDETKTTEEKVEEVKNTDTETLKNQIETEMAQGVTGTSDTMDLIEDLEDQVKTDSGITVDAGVAPNANQVVATTFQQVSDEAIVGAVLNAKDNVSEVKLVIGNPSGENEVGTDYDPDTGVVFSMTLEGVEDASNLDVPVKITLPVPAGIGNLNKLVVLHYHDGVEEAVNYTLSTGADGKAYVTFLVSGFSDFAIVEEAAPEIEKFNLSGTAMTLGNSLSMDFAVNVAKLANNGEGHYALITKHYADGRADVVTRIEREDWKVYGGTIYTASCSGIAAKEMCDEVEVVFYNADGYAVTNTYTDSVKSYAMRTLNNTANQSKTELLTTIVDMLNYGAAAQQVFGYDTENLANADLTEAQQAMATTEINPSDARVKGPGYAGSTLTLESQILLDFVFFDSTLGTDLTGMYAIAAYTDHYGNEKEIRLDEFKLYASGLHYVSVSGMAVADCSSVVSCTIYNSNGDAVASASDSVEGYIARQLASGRTDAIYTAILKFAASAYNYFH